jgi:predicted flap endonuclease-1-like 5' DNA nuclease
VACTESVALAVYGVCSLNPSLARRLERTETDMAGMENDLHKLKGIGPKHTEMLESIGVDSIKELSHRNAASLVNMIETRHGKVIGLSEASVQGWIDEAKSVQQ